MGPETRAAALKKLDGLGIKIGYPDKWRDYSNLQVKAQPHVLNVLAASAFETQRQLAKIGKPANTDSRAVAVLKLSRVRFLGRDRWRHTGAVRASAKIAKNRSEQVPPIHWVGTYLAYSSSRHGVESSKNRIKNGLCVNYPHSLNVRSELLGFHLLTQKRARSA